MKTLPNRQNAREMVISFMFIRRTVGILGILLPPVLAVGIRIYGSSHWIEASISNYAYTIMGNVLVGVLCAFSLFLFTYRGYNKWDNRWSSLAGLFALGIAFFPMNISKSISDADIFIRCDDDWRDHIHYASAGLFFVTLSIISYWQFTKSRHHSTEDMTPQKRARNVIYRVCAVVMFVSIVLIGCLKLFHLGENIPLQNPTFWLEVVALYAFATSWLTKGEFILSD
jgi:hypothetical protein